MQVSQRVRVLVLRKSTGVRRVYEGKYCALTSLSLRPTGLYTVRRVWTYNDRVIKRSMRCAGIDGTHVVQLGPRHAEIERFVERSFLVRDPVDFDDRVVTAARVRPRKFSEWAFQLALTRQDSALQDILRAPGNIQLLAAFHHRIRVALQYRHLVLRLVIEDLHGSTYQRL